MSGDNFNYDFFPNAPDGSELGPGWEEIPPAFMGTTSSFGQQPRMATNGLPDIHFNDGLPHISSVGPPIPSSTSADVLAAATMLQNGSIGRSHSTGNEALFPRQEHQLQSTNGQMRPLSMSQYVPARSATMQDRVPSDDYMRDTFYTEMMFGSESSPLRTRLVNSKADIRWGSDSGFGAPQGFIPPTNQEKVSAMERAHVKAVQTAFLEMMPHQSSSAETTRPSSPAQTHSITDHQKTKSLCQPKNEDDQDSRPRKRRKSKYQEEPDDDDEDDDEESPTSAMDKAGSKKRKSTKKLSKDLLMPAAEQSQKRRKSLATANAAAKTARENLTEDQKRENHIKSEQKRRTLIREGFENLGKLVPGLRGGGFSKSAVLIMAADWLEDLIQGNEVLRRRLDALQGRA